MKHLRETFTDQEFEAIEHIKKETKLSWHDFIIATALHYKEVGDIVKLKIVPDKMDGV